MPASAEQQIERRRAIAAILRERPVATQGELVRVLHELGFDATQSSVSRDLRILGAAKEAEGYRLRAADPAAAGSATTGDAFAEVAGFVRAVKRAGANLVVVQTGIGAAQRVAVALDRSRWPEIVGTLSGDDTIFVATPGAAASARLESRLNDIFAERTP
ncbi:arginine repressor [Lentisalinibacter orientalis]|uniref:arginine repressor n=1 Tax=Lentisalinibacter orientalis TaxID=2992241 RepID=UPI003865FEEF